MAEVSVQNLETLSKEGVFCEKGKHMEKNKGCWHLIGVKCMEALTCVLFPNLVSGECLFSQIQPVFLMTTPIWQSSPLYFWLYPWVLIISPKSGLWGTPQGDDVSLLQGPRKGGGTFFSV